jgi:hypothetical protein
MEWCEALVTALQAQPGVDAAVREWGGRTFGVVIGRDGALDRDFCVFARPHAVEPRMLEMRLCEDEDDLELEEPDYLFRAPLGTVRQLMTRQLDPLEVLRKGQVRVEGDLKFLIPYGQKHQRLGETAVACVETVP